MPAKQHNLPTKPCAVCMVVMTPKRTDAYNSESLNKFNARITCSKECRGMYLMRRARLSLPKKDCVGCKKPLVRKVHGKRNKPESITKFTKRRFCSKSCYSETRKASDCELHPDYIRQLATKLVHKTACKKCGAKSSLAVHHISGKATRRSDNALDNLMVLCRSCHVLLHHHVRQSRGNLGRAKGAYC